MKTGNKANKQPDKRAQMKAMTHKQTENKASDTQTDFSATISMPYRCPILLHVHEKQQQLSEIF